MQIRSSFPIPLLLLLVFPAAVHAGEPLPGILDPAEVKGSLAKAAGQKKDAQAVVSRSARLLGYSPAQIDRALEPAMVRSGSFRMSLGDGTVVEFPWHRTGFAENRLANTAKAITRDSSGLATRRETNKGGVRLHKGVFADEVYALALKMDTKLGTARDAHGKFSFRGAKGGIGAGRVVKVGRKFSTRIGDYVDPASPAFDRAKIMKAFARSYRKTGGDVGLGLDIQAGDVNTKAAEMKVLAEQGYGTSRKPSQGVSGKAVRRHKDGSIDPRGGIEYRATSTGDGVWMATRLAARRAGLKVRGATVVAQGWGEVGRAFGMSAVKDGARVIAVQELWKVGGKRVAGIMHHPLGARAKPAQVKTWLADMEAARAAGKDLKTYKGGALLKHLKVGEDASSVRADIVGINAMGNTLNKSTVPAYRKSGTHHGKRKILAEGANLAQTADGARLLDRYRGSLLTISGDLANLGGVHVSNLEAMQNNYREAVSSKQAKRSLLGTMRAGWNRAMKIADKRGVSERKAIELAAVDNMMKRSLQLPKAPRAAMEKRVISQAAIKAKRGGKARPRVKKSAPRRRVPTRYQQRRTVRTRR